MSAVAAVPYFVLNGTTIGSGNLQLQDGALIALQNTSTQTYLQANTGSATYTVASSSIGAAQTFRIVDPKNGKLALLGNNNFYMSGIYGKSYYTIADGASSVTANYCWFDVIPGSSNGLFALRNASSGNFYMNVSGQNVLLTGGGVVASTTWKIVPVSANSICALASNNMLTDFCQTGCSQDMTGCAAAYIGFCPTGNNLSSDLCRVYGKTNAAQQATYDVWYANYCKANPTNYDFCACSNASPAAESTEKILSQAGINVIPICNRSSCSTNNNAWKTAQMSSLNCPTQQICYQSLNGVISESEVSNISFACTQASTSTSAASTTSSSSTSSSANPTTAAATTTTPASSSSATSSSLTTQQYWYIGGGVSAFVTFSVIVVFIVVYRRNKKV